MPRLDRPIVVPWIRLDRDADAEEALALARAREPWCAGFCLFGGDAPRVERLTRRLREAAGRPLVVASDMERGAGQQVAGLAVLPDAAVWGLAGSPRDVRAFGELTAREARSVGVNVLFAPVLDVRSEPANPIVGNRAFSWDPDRVARLGAAFVDGALEGGCAPTAKHFPGHGATLADSHDAVPTVADPVERLEARDLATFAAAFDALCPAAMTAHVAYPALDPSGAIATFSRPVVDRLRAMADDADISVAVFTDALLMAGAATPGGEVEAARRALAAGCDALLIPENPERLADELLGDGTGDADLRVDLAAARLRALADLVEELASSPARTDDPLRLVAPRVADRAVRAAGLQDLDPLSPGDLVVLLDDDDLPSRGEVLARRVRGAGVEVRTVRVPRGGPVPAGLDRLDPRVVVVFSSVRAWKGAHDLSPSGREALDLLARKGAKVVALAPRGEGAHFLVPGTGPDVEASVADVLLGE